MQPEIVAGLMDSLAVLIAHGREAVERAPGLRSAVRTAEEIYRAIEALEAEYRDISALGELSR